ncbi:MAG: isoprenylcysteine carboxylmethyltransferase family protein [Dehalococcoidia bacterium]
MTGRTSEAPGWALVAGQFALFAVLAVEVLRARRVGLLGLAGIGAIALGSALMALASSLLGRRLRAHPAPHEDAVLRTDGIYGVVRHPIYLGVLSCAAGAVLIARTPRAAAAFAALSALLHVKSGYEERLLTEHFPDYPAYAARVSKLVPGL